MVGRVIRTDEDKLLIDERFSLSSYKMVFPEEWKKVRYAANVEIIHKTIGASGLSRFLTDKD